LILETASPDVFQKAKAGDPQAFQELIRPHLDSLRRFVFSLSKDWQDADDIAQEALIKAFRAFPTFDGRAALSTWLYTVARSASIDWHRSRMGQASQREKALPSAHPAALPGQDEACSQQQDRERLWQAIQRLDERNRVPLVLFEVEGLSYDEIASIEGVPVGTIRSRLSRARQELRQQLAELEPASSGVRGEEVRRVGSMGGSHG
jgi:RNA polymerase sigma-70 factor, ECF subfamily